MDVLINKRPLGSYRYAPAIVTLFGYRHTGVSF